MRRLLYTLTLAALTAVGLFAQNQGGAFIPSADYSVTGLWTFTQTPAIAAGGSIVTTTGTQTLTNKTLTAPTLTAVAITGTSTIGNGMTITTPVLSGTVTGTYTLGGTPTLASAAGVPYVAGVAAGYKLARGTITLDGSNPSSAATGLTTVVSCNVSGPAAAAIPGDDPMGATPFINTTNLDIYAWKTDGTDPTPVASTNSAAVFYWVCAGT